MKKKAILILFIFIFLVILLMALLLDKPSFSPEYQNIRTFKVGFANIPNSTLAGDALLAYQKAANNSEIMLIATKINWTQYNETWNATDDAIFDNVKMLSDVANYYNLSVYVAIDPLESSNRSQLDNAIPWQNKNFQNAQIQESIKNFAYRIAHEISPEYLTIGMEINTYYQSNATDFAYFVNAFENTSKIIRNNFPEIKLGPTYQYEQMVAENNFTVLSFFENKTDFVGITTYPLGTFPDFASVPEDYYIRIRQHTSKQLVVGESGWPTNSTAYPSSPEDQRAFAELLFNTTNLLGSDILIWWFMHDCDYPECAGYNEYFRSMGFIYSNGTEKSSWSVPTEYVHNRTYITLCDDRYPFPVNYRADLIPYSNLYAFSNLTSLPDSLSSIPNFTVSLDNFERITFQSAISLIPKNDSGCFIPERLNLDNIFAITNNSITINSNNEEINSPALLTFYGAFSAPRITDNGVDCSSYCTIVQQNENYTQVLVTGAGNYRIQEKICGDNICDNGETCSSCSTDCGACSSGNGGGGGSSNNNQKPQCNDLKDNDNDGFTDFPDDKSCSSKTDNSETNIETCEEEWVCTEEWSECINGIQQQNCVDINNCNTTLKKPNNSRICLEENNQNIKNENKRVIVFVLVSCIVLLAVISLYLAMKRNKNKKELSKKWQ